MDKCIVLLLLATITVSLCGWSGYDWDSGSFIDIESRDGTTVEYYDWSAGRYKTGEIMDWGYDGSSNDLEILEYDTGNYRTFDMD